MTEFGTIIQVIQVTEKHVFRLSDVPAIPGRRGPSVPKIFEIPKPFDLVDEI